MVNRCSGRLQPDHGVSWARQWNCVVGIASNRPIIPASPTKEPTMAKEQRTAREGKKAPAKSMKEKRAAKAAKRTK